MITEYFTYMLILLVTQRLMELMVSRHNETQLKEKGAVEYGKGHYPWMVALHAGWFFSMIAEYAFFDRTLTTFWLPLLAVIVLLQVGRYYIIKSLGGFWNVKIIILPGSERIRSGIYAFVKHPNYWVVRVELFLIPLLFELYITSLIFTVLNFFLLQVRIREEEKALSLLN